MRIEGILTSPGYFLIQNKKGLCYDEKYSKNSAIYIEKVEGCEKSGEKDCPYEGKLYHLLFTKNSKKLINNRKYHNTKVNVVGRFYTDERALEVVGYWLTNEGKVEEMNYSSKIPAKQEEATLKDNFVYKCSMHPEITSDKPGDCRKCGMKLERINK